MPNHASSDLRAARGRVRVGRRTPARTRSDQQGRCRQCAGRAKFGVNYQDVGRQLQELDVSYRPAELRAAIDKLQADNRDVTLEGRALGRERQGGVLRHHALARSPTRIAAALGTRISFVDVTEYHGLQGGAPAFEAGARDGLRGAAVDQRGARDDERGAPVDGRGARDDERGAAVDQRGARDHERGAAVDERRIADDERRAAESQHRPELRERVPGIGLHQPAVRGRRARSRAIACRCGINTRSSSGASAQTRPVRHTFWGWISACRSIS